MTEKTIIAGGMLLVTALDDRKSTLINIDHIVGIQDRPEGGVIIYLSSGAKPVACGTVDGFWAEFLNAEIRRLKSGAAA